MKRATRKNHDPGALPPGAWAYRADADLTADFPFKSSNPYGRMSIVFWMRPRTVPTTEDTGPLFICGKEGSWRVTVEYNTRLGVQEAVFSMPHGTVTIERCACPMVILAGHKYHAGVTFDDTTGAVRMRVYDMATDNVTQATADFVKKIQRTTGAWVVGDPRPLRLKELAIFSRVLSAEEIDAIRQGCYEPPAKEEGSGAGP